MTNRLPVNIFDLKTINIIYDPIETKWSKMTPFSIKDQVDEIDEDIRADPECFISKIQIVFINAI